jgi:hypothetical protein
MRGRPPEGSAKVGHVTWEEELSCFVGSFGFYWHGHKFGGWQKEKPPDPKDRKRPVSSGGGGNGNGDPDRVCRGRRPNGNERIGVIVTYNIEHDCYQTEKEYYWHGTYNGGWKKNAPGVDSDVESEAENEEEKKEKDDNPDNDVDRPPEKKRKGNTKGRPPRKQIVEETIEYNSDKLCWTTTREGGLYWHGTYKGGWKNYPPKTTD